MGSKKVQTEAEESIILDLGSLITQDLEGIVTEETVSKDSLAKWIAEDPEMAAYYQQRKDKERKAKDGEQDKMIRIVIRRLAAVKCAYEDDMKAQSERLVTLEKWVRYGQGAVASLAVVWALFSFIVPKIWTKEATKAVFCAQVNKCVDRRIERYNRSQALKNSTGRTLVQQPGQLRASPPPPPQTVEVSSIVPRSREVAYPPAPPMFRLVPRRPARPRERK